MNIQDIKDLAPWVSSGIAFATLFINTYPKFKAWCRKEEKRIRLNRFFKKISPNFNTSEIENLVLLNYNDPKDDKKQEQGTLQFYKYQKIFFNWQDDYKINGVLISKGYQIYKILSEDCIRLDLIDDDSGERKSAFIFKNNNIKSNNPDNLKVFEKIIKWKYE